MWATLIPVVIQMIPSLVGGVESLFSHKAKSGAEKLNAVQTLALNAVQLAGIVDPSHIGDPERRLVAEISGAIVAYNNSRGVFGHQA